MAVWTCTIMLIRTLSSISRKLQCLYIYFLFWVININLWSSQWSHSVRRISRAVSRSNWKLHTQRLALGRQWRENLRKCRELDSIRCRSAYKVSWPAHAARSIATFDIRLSLSARRKGADSSGRFAVQELDHWSAHISLEKERATNSIWLQLATNDSTQTSRKTQSAFGDWRSSSKSDKIGRVLRLERGQMVSVLRHAVEKMSRWVGKFLSLLTNILTMLSF